MLNTLWLGFFVTSALAALVQWLAGGNAAGLFRHGRGPVCHGQALGRGDAAAVCTLTLWLGFAHCRARRPGRNPGALAGAAVYAQLMPGVPRGHPALGLMTLNFAANALGLDNAATPIGLKAMHSLQSLNPEPQTATNAQILFLVLNASSLTLLPVSIFMYRLQQGASDPTLVFVPILLATSASTLVGCSPAFVQRLPWRRWCCPACCRCCPALPRWSLSSRP